MDNDHDKEIYILASLAEIEVQMTLGQKIQEIVDETLHGKKSGPARESKKNALDSYFNNKTSKSQQRRQSQGSAKGGSQKRKNSAKGSSTLQRPGKHAADSS